MFFNMILFFLKWYHETLKRRSTNAYKFSNHDIKKFILLLQKCVYSYKYTNNWEKFNETLIPEKEDFTVT